MNGVITIFKKEFKGFFFSPTFWVICFLVSLVWSWVYPIQLNRFAQLLMNFVAQQGIPQNQLNIHFAVFLPQLSNLNLMLIFVIPALTMKLFAEEKKLRTFDLLLTSPVTSLQIVLGKYFAVMGAIAGLGLLCFLYPVATSALVKVNWVPLIIAFLGLLLLGGVYAAMDLFASSVTENTIVAYVASVMMNVSVWFVGFGTEVADSASARKFFEHVSLSTHLSSLLEGTIRTNGLIFLLSVIVLFCFLAERMVESSRWR